MIDFTGIWDRFKGKRTYMAAAMLGLFALFGLVAGKHNAMQAVKYMLEALAIAGFRGALE